MDLDWFSEINIYDCHTIFLDQNLVGNSKIKKKIQNLENFAYFSGPTLISFLIYIFLIYFCLFVCPYVLKLLFNRLRYWFTFFCKSVGNFVYIVKKKKLCQKISFLPYFRPRKWPKISIFAHFGPIWPNFGPKKILGGNLTTQPATCHDFLLKYAKSAKSNEANPRNWTPTRAGGPKSRKKNHVKKK